LLPAGTFAAIRWAIPIQKLNSMPINYTQRHNKLRIYPLKRNDWTAAWLNG